MPRTSPAGQPEVVEASRPHALRRLAASAPARLLNQLTDDYSTEKSKPVPVSARVPRWHLTAVWITLLGGVPALAIGVDYYQSGYSLVRALATVVIGGCCYLAYAIPAAYLGARTGRGTALLTRAVLGSAASVVISDLQVAVGAARLAFGSTVAASLYAGLFGWRDVAVVAAALAVIAAAINLFGFGGIAAAARYVSAPLLLAWGGYLVARGLVSAHAGLGAPSARQTLSFQAGISVAIGAIAWGNEPDIWRYENAKPRWPVVPYLTSLAAGSLLLTAAGWLTASLSKGGTQAAFVHGVRVSAFGVVGLAAVVITLLQISNSAGACYQMTNAIQNLAGHLRSWRRWHTAVLVAALGGLTSWAIHGSVTGFARLAAWSAVVLPSVTVVMCLELLARRQPGADRIRRVKIPPWGRGRRPNWAAIAVVVVAAGYGGWGMALLPGQHSAPGLGFVPAESWLVAAGLYGAVMTARSGYALARSAVGRARGAAVQAAARRAEARQQAARRAEARQQARSSRASARRQARTRRAAAKRAAVSRRRARPPGRPAVPVPPPRPRPRDYLEAIRRDIATVASGNPYLDLVAAGTLSRERLGTFAAEQAQLRASDRRSFLYLAARSDDVAGSVFAELADTERRALDLLTIFTRELGQAESGADPPPAGCRAYPAFVAWLALNAEPADAAVALLACLPSWSASLSGIGRALREHASYRLGDRACAFFDLVAAPDPHAEDQLIGLLQAKIDAGQPPSRATGYARLLASYQATFWSTLAAEATGVGATEGRPR